MAADGTGTPQAYPIGAILGTAAANLLNVTEQQPSTVTGQLTLTATPTTTFGTLDNGTTTIMISGDPLSGTAPTVVFSGTEATQYQSFANMAPSDLLGALSTLGSAMDDVGESSQLSVDVPLTDMPVGEAADFGTIFDTDIVNALTNSSNTPVFDSIQTFETDLAALPGVTGATVVYNSGSNQFDIAFTLSEGFPAQPASFAYDLSGASGTTLGNLTDVSATTATATLSISGTGTVAVGFDFSLTPNSVQIQGVTPVPSNGVLAAGSDAQFTLYLSAPGIASPGTPVPVTVAASATQSNTTPAQLLADINTALQNALTSAGLAANLVVASFASGTHTLVLTMIPGAYTDMSVTTLPNGPAVYELGLAPANTPTASIVGQTAVPSNGQLSSDATFTVTADGGTATPVTITAASTAGNVNRTQLLTQVNAALAPVNTALAAANRSIITASLTSANLLSFSISGYASTLSITDANTGAQTGLGMAPSGSVQPGALEVYAEASAGTVPTDGVLTQDTTFAITVDGQPTMDVTVTAASTQNNDAPVATGITNPTPQQLLAEEEVQTPLQLLTNEINQALATLNNELAAAGLAEVTASIGSAAANADLDAGEATTGSDQVLFFSTLGNSATIVVQGQPGNQLGIGSDDASATPMLMVAGGQSFLDNIDVTKLTLNANLTVTGSVSATAELGAVAIDLGPTNSFTLAPTVSLSLESGFVPLANLTANPASIGNFFSTTLGGAASVTLPVSAADGLGSALGLDANAALTLNATDMFTLSGWTANTSALEGLTNLQDFSFADAQAAVTQLGSLIAASTASTSGLFGQLVPLINQPLGSVTGISQDFANLAADLQPGMNFTLDQLQGALNTAIGQAFGISTTGNYVTVQLSGNLLQLTLNFTPDLAQQSNVPLNFDLPNMGIPSNSNLPGVKDFTGSDMTVTPSASFNLVLDIDMSSPTNPVYDLGAATQFMLGLLIDGPASGTVSLGPLGLTFAGATLALSATASGTTPATFAIGLTGTTPLATLKNDLTNNTWLNNAGPVTATITGQVNVSLPLSESAGGNATSVGTLTLTIPNLSAFTTALLTSGNPGSELTFNPPNLASTFSSDDLLGNVTGIIGALDNYLDQLQSLLNGQLFGLDIPLVGNALSSAGSFVTQIKNDIDAIASSGASEFQGIYDALTNVLKQFDPATPVVQIQYLDPAQSSSFQDFTPGEATSLLPNAQAIQDVQIILTLGSTWTPLTSPVFNLGLPGFGLSASAGAVQVSVGWSLTFTVGIDRSIGPYIVAPPSGSSNVTADITANVKTGGTISAQLGFLALTATQPTPGQADPANPSNTALPTQVALNFSAGFTGGSSSIGGESVIQVSSFGASNLGNISLTGSASVDLDLALGFDFSSGGGVDTEYPNFTAQLLVGVAPDDTMSGGSTTPGAWTFGVGLNGANSTAPSVSLNNISLDLGDFLNQYLGKIIDPLAEVLEPLQPILNFLNTPIPSSTSR